MQKKFAHMLVPLPRDSDEEQIFGKSNIMPIEFWSVCVLKSLFVDFNILGHSVLWENTVNKIYKSKD